MLHNQQINPLIELIDKNLTTSRRVQGTLGRIRLKRFPQPYTGDYIVVSIAQRYYFERITADNIRAVRGFSFASSSRG